MLIAHNVKNKRTWVVYELKDVTKLVPLYESIFHLDNDIGYGERNVS